MLLLAAFAVIALFLAASGTYGVISYSVSARTHEIGIRMALGARRRDVVNMVVGQGLMLAGGGLLTGLALSFGLTRALASLLFGVSVTDPLIFTLVILVLAAVSLLASYIPARRATQVDPMVALREQ